MPSPFLRRMAREGPSRLVGPYYIYNFMQMTAVRPSIPITVNVNATSTSSSENVSRSNEIHTLPPSQRDNRTPASPSSADSEHAIPNWKISNPRKVNLKLADLPAQSLHNGLPGEADADSLHFRR